MRLLKPLTFISFLVTLFSVSARPSSAAITDTSEDLIVPAGESYTLSGTKSYSRSIQIFGTLSITPYNGTANTGWLVLQSPQATISSTGIIIAEGKGYRPDEGPGKGGTGVSSSGNHNSGDGAGYGGIGGLSTDGNSPGVAGTPYGSIINPVDMGSGGGGGWNGYAAGGSGGGKIQLQVSGTLVNEGVINVNGAQGLFSSYWYSTGGGGGSGGSISIVAGQLSGTGQITANGGDGGCATAGGGSGGRIAIRCGSDNFQGTVTAYGGGGIRAGCGTVLRKLDSQLYGDLYLRNIASGRHTYCSGEFDKIVIDRFAVAYATLSFTANQVAVSGDGAFANYGAAKVTQLIILSSAAVHQRGGTFTVDQAQVENSTLCIDHPMQIGDIDINSGGMLTHSSKNSNFLLLVSGNLTVAQGGRIFADAKGYGPSEGPGVGGTGNNSSSGNNNSGDGAGYGGVGGLSTDGSNPGVSGMPYGSITNPVDFGSGGGAGWNGNVAGGSGGGKIELRVSGALVNDGVISANGSNGLFSMYWYSTGGGGGSGGSISIVAGQLSGTGHITATGGDGGCATAGGGSGGRIAVKCGSDNFQGTVAAYGGGGIRAGCGTILRKLDSQLYGDLYLRNIGSGRHTYCSGNFDKTVIDKFAVVYATMSFSASQMTVSGRGALANYGTIKVTQLVITSSATAYHRSGEFTVDQVQLEDGTLSVDQPMQIGNAVINSGGTITHTAKESDFSLSVSGNLTVAQGGRITADAKGYGPGEGPGKGGTGTDSNGGGGGYGGLGGTSVDSSPGGTPYGSIMNPVDLGSGGGTAWNGNVTGGSGGGKIELRVSGTVLNDGIISANGSNGIYSAYWWQTGSGGGSGGSIYIVASQFSGIGQIKANGGDGGGSNAGGGSGGRIAVYYKNSFFTGSVETQGGGNGGNGTVFMNSLLADSPVSLATLSDIYSRDNTIYETITRQNVIISNRIFRNDRGITGSIGFSGFEKVDVKTSSFANNGFFRSDMVLTIGGTVYTCRWKGMSFVSTKERKMYLKGYFEGTVAGAIDMLMQESSYGSNVYDLYTATVSVTEVGSQLNTDKIYLEGTAEFQDGIDYPNTAMMFVQTNIVGDSAGNFTGNLSVMMNYLQINDIGNPYNGQGFSIMSYDSELGQGAIYAYTQYNAKTALSGLITGALDGYVLGSFDYQQNPKELLLSIFKFDYGQQVQDYLDIKLNTVNNVSPGQTITYTVELRNNGLQDAANIKVIVNLPVAVRFVDATGKFFYENASEGELVAYPDPNETPESVAWQIPLVPAGSTMLFSVKGTVKWGLPADSMLEAVAGIYDYDPDFYK